MSALVRELVTYAKQNLNVKKLANRVVRRYLHPISNGNAYRRLINQWDICDWKYMYSSRPTYYWSKGEMKVFEPDPLWKARRK